jgi:hypothetical protein
MEFNGECESILRRPELAFKFDGDEGEVKRQERRANLKGKRRRKSMRILAFSAVSLLLSPPMTLFDSSCREGRTTDISHDYTRECYAFFAALCLSVSIESSLQSRTKCEGESTRVLFMFKQYISERVGRSLHSMRRR